MFLERHLQKKCIIIIIIIILLNNVYLFIYFLTLLFTLNGDISALSLLPARSGEAGPPDRLLVPSLSRVVMAMGAPAPACVVVVPIATGHRPPAATTSPCVWCRPSPFGFVSCSSSSSSSL